jgi:gas vesicle protein
MSKSSKSFWAFMLGAATGATLGILYAPDKGENTRDKLAFQLQKYRDQLKSLIEELVDGNDVPENMGKSESKKVVTEARQKAERLLSDVENLMGQIKSQT